MYIVDGEFVVLLSRDFCHSFVALELIRLISLSVIVN